MAAMSAARRAGRDQRDHPAHQRGGLAGAGAGLHEQRGVEVGGDAVAGGLVGRRGEAHAAHLVRRCGAARPGRRRGRRPGRAACAPSGCGARRCRARRGRTRRRRRTGRWTFGPRGGAGTRRPRCRRRWCRAWLRVRGEDLVGDGVALALEAALGS